MKYAKIDTHDVANGEGVGVALFVQGCRNHCPGCFNQSTWDFNGGEEFRMSQVDEILKAMEPSYVSRLSILGGEPLELENAVMVWLLVRKVKETYPDKKVWLYTGNYIWRVPRLLTMYCDYIVDGPYEQDKKDLSLIYRGSWNQTIYKNVVNEENRNDSYFIPVAWRKDNGDFNESGRHY